MRTLLLALCLLLPLAPVQAQSRLYSQPELDALLAPIALYPDPLLSQILTAAVYPDQVAQAADWSRRNPGVSGDDAVQMVQDQPWEPGVKALVAYPDVLARMGESPQWTSDLGNAFLGQQTQTMTTVQTLRQRAQASGYLRSDGEQQVYQQGPAIVVQPVYPQYVYVRYYDPLVVYGTWWWPAYRPVFWRPWAPRVVFVNQVTIVSRQIFVTRPHVWSRPWHNVPESQRQPIIQSSPRPQIVRVPLNMADQRPDCPVKVIRVEGRHAEIPIEGPKRRVPGASFLEITHRRNVVLVAGSNDAEIVIAVRDGGLEFFS